MSNNLKRGNPETQFKAGREQAETARKGGIASGKARREKRDMKDTALIMLSMSLREGKIDNIEKETNKVLLEKEVMEVDYDGYELEVWVK